MSKKEKVMSASQFQRVYIPVIFDDVADVELALVARFFLFVVNEYFYQVFVLFSAKHIKERLSTVRSTARSILIDLKNVRN